MGTRFSALETYCHQKRRIELQKGMVSRNYICGQGLPLYFFDR